MPSPMSIQVLDTIMQAAPVIPVVTIENADDAIPLARCLAANGLPVVEITLRTPAGLEAVRRIAQAVPEALVGAGTLLTPDDVAAAADAGARFAVSPGLTPSLAKSVQAADLPLLPGVATASEVMRAMEDGFTRLKFFPAEPSGGTAALKALHGPLAAAVFCPTGGITPDNAAAYLALPNVTCVGGSWIAPAGDIAAGNWDAVAARAAKASANAR